MRLLPLSASHSWGHTLTSPSQSTGQLAAKETTTNNCDGLDLPGNLLQPLEVLDLKEHLPPFPILPIRNGSRKHLCPVSPLEIRVTLPSLEEVCCSFLLFACCTEKPPRIPCLCKLFPVQEISNACISPYISRAITIRLLNSNVTSSTGMPRLTSSIPPFPTEQSTPQDKSSTEHKTPMCLLIPHPFPELD